jgi:tripeptide aminopeptidase
MTIDALRTDPGVLRARAVLRETDDETLADMLAAVAIPAPPFGEEARGAWIRRRFQELGLAAIRADDAGNVLAECPLEPDRDAGDAGDTDDAGAAGAVLVAAHLDTVFPAGTDLTVRRDGDRLRAPGIADNCRGLAALLALARALRAADVRTRRRVVFVATVGEEGAGDLRGVKRLFRPGSPWRAAAAFIALDGSGRRRIVNGAVGSLRLRVTLTGNGGHSWADWGLANPLHAAGIAIADLARLPLRRQPRTALTVARAGGGTSINAIPDGAWFELDLRSEGGDALVELGEQVEGILLAAKDEVNSRRRRGTPRIQLATTRIGDRPGGATPADAPLVRLAEAATRELGEVPELVASSTDANVPIALGIPAITMGAGGDSGGTHTLDEWYANTGGPEGLERALLTVLGSAGLAGE